ncbi:MAG: transposase [Acidimicrobiales bacterium]
MATWTYKVKGWLNRRDDPEFWDRVQDVCGLYLNGPENAIVVRVDEKTAIQAKERIVATIPAAPGRPGRYEFEYRRHGTASLLAAMDVHSGEVLATDIARNNSVTFIDFLDQIERNVAPSLAIHLVMDNGSSHTSKETRKWLAAHPRFVATEPVRQRPAVPQPTMDHVVTPLRAHLAGLRAPGKTPLAGAREVRLRRTTTHPRLP